jgi:1,4-dihydroxy-2-naphthoyl-CoA hydrolase
MPSTDPNRGADAELTGFDAFYGMEIDHASAEEMRAHLVVQEHHKQPVGLLHGGVLASMAEAMASIGAWLGAGKEKASSGINNNTSFLRPVTQGTVHAVARPRHSGRTTAVWEIEFTDDDGRLCALTRMTIALRDLPAG